MRLQDRYVGFESYEGKLTDGLMNRKQSNSLSSGVQRHVIPQASSHDDCVLTCSRIPKAVLSSQGGQPIVAKQAKDTC